MQVRNDDMYILSSVCITQLFRVELNNLEILSFRDDGCSLNVQQEKYLEHAKSVHGSECGCLIFWSKRNGPGPAPQESFLISLSLWEITGFYSVQTGLNAHHHC
jgi:hypothetical protein